METLHRRNENVLSLKRKLYVVATQTFDRRNEFLNPQTLFVNSKLCDKKHCFV